MVEPRFLRLLTALAAGALVAAGCGGSRERASVVLVTLDTTRADRVGAYGDPSGRTPVLDAWARCGVLVRDVVADVPLTLPSHVTLLTGVPALAHGVRTNEGNKLSERAVTLAERFRERGYRTAAIVSTRVLATSTGVAQGFEHFDDAIEEPYVVQNAALFPKRPHWMPPEDRRASRAVESALAWLRERREGEPFFLWIHLYDPHFPYDPPRPFLAADVDAYGAEIRAVDAALAQLRHELEARPDADRTRLVVVADHGEGLEDHREAEHGLFLYDDTMRVPCLILGGDVPANRILDGQARTLDVAPTILELAHDPHPTLGLGVSLVGEITGRRPAAERPAYGETILPRVSWSGAALKSLRTGTEKYILAPRPELYDLARDPGETRDLADSAPERAAERRRALEEFVRDVLARDLFVAEPSDRPAREHEALQALGYVGGASPAGPPDVASELATDGFDPKDLVDVVLAGRAVENGFLETAERKLARFFADLAARNAEVPTKLVSLAHQNEAAIRMAQGEFVAAAQSYRASLAAEASNADARSGLVFALNLAGRSRDAEREAARLLTETPDAPKLRLHRGLALALLGRGDEARAELDRVAATARDPQEVDVARQYAQRIGTPEEAEWLRMYLGSEGRAQEGR